MIVQSGFFPAWLCTILQLQWGKWWMDILGALYFQSHLFLWVSGKKHWSFRGFSPALIKKNWGHCFTQKNQLWWRWCGDFRWVPWRTFEQSLEPGRPSNFWVSKNPLNPKRRYVRCRNPSWIQMFRNGAMDFHIIDVTIVSIWAP